MAGVNHYIKPLTQTRIPKSHIVIAAASTLGGDRSGYTQTWRRASLWATRQRPSGEQKIGRQLYVDKGSLWGEVHRWSLSSGLTFLWLHDLQWTARVTGLLETLGNLGWRLDAFALNPSASWMVWRYKKHTLKIVDLLSIWPHGIDRLGQWFGLGRKEMPAHDASDMAWNAYVTRDRDILVHAVESYVDWIERENLGTLAVTGNAQAWKAFRRRFLTHGISVHHDPDVRALERRAMWTGRAEAWWRGSLLRETVDEWDFSMAHNEIVRAQSVPVFPDRPIYPGAHLGALIADDRYTVLAEVEVETSTPCIPTDRAGGIAWPIGRFRTALWGPELRIALDFCDGVCLVHGWVYRMEPVLQRWGDWIAARMDTADVAVPAWEKDLLKRWSNVMPGRFGMRHPRWRKMGRSRVSTLSMATLNDGTGADLGSIVQIGHDLWEESGKIEPHDAAPMITGYVMSAMRAKLWRLMQGIHPKALLYVDTDSVLVPDTHRAWMKRLARQPEFAGLRLKRSWDGLSIYGPRQLVTGAEVRIAGLPRSAQRLGRGDFEGEVTESLLEALRAGHPGAVRSVARQWEIAGVDTRRDGTGFGWTWPFHVDGTRGG